MYSARQNPYNSGLHSGSSYFMPGSSHFWHTIKHLFQTTRLAFWSFAIATPPLWIAWLIWHAGSLPDNDYWGYLGSILRPDGVTGSPSAWLAHNTEHIVVIPKLIYVLNLYLSGGDNRMLGGIALALAAGQGWLLYKTARQTLPEASPLLVLVILSVLLFPARAVHNWMMGMSGVVWIGANLCAIGTFHLLWKGRTIPACLLGTLGLLIYSSTLAIWPALLIGAWLSNRPKRDIFIVAAAGMVAVVLYLSRFHTPSGHPPLEKNLLHLLEYLMLFIGGLWTNQLPIALGMGILGVMTSAWMLIRMLGQAQTRLMAAPWLMLQIYALGNGAMAAAARSGFGMEQAFSSRYATLPALFWLGLTFTAWIHLRHSLSARFIASGALTGVIVLGISSGWASLPATNHFMRRSALKPLAMVSLYTGGFDYPLLAKAVTPVVNAPSIQRGMPGFLELLKVHHHVPFDGTFAACPEMGKKIEDHGSNAASVQTAGVFDQAQRLFPQTVKVGGWAHSKKGKIRCIALTNQDKIVRGIAISGFPRPDVAKTLQIGNPDTGWEGYVRIQPGDRSLSAWARIGDAWHPLQRTIPVPRLGPTPSNSEVTHQE